MKTTNQPFQLEDTIPGTFLLQGLIGGHLGGFACIVASCLWQGNAYFDWVTALTPFFMVAGAIFGVIKATIMWGFYRLTGIRMGALARVAVSSIGAYGLAMFLNLQLESGNESDFAFWLILTLSPAIATALFVGSNVKPWELFTFGSIVVDGQRVGSKSVLATIGTLPLRFLSLIALAVWILRYICPRRTWEELSIGSDLDLTTFLFPAIYFALSAYLTFRSPRKVVLPVWGLLLNLYVALIAFFSFLIYMNVPQLSDSDWIFFVTSISFIIAWAIFLIARLAAPTNDVKPLTILPPASTRPRITEHQCLGTRFVEWQKHVA